MEIGIDFFVDTNILIYALEGHPAIVNIVRCSPGIKGFKKIEDVDIVLLDLFNE